MSASISRFRKMWRQAERNTPELMIFRLEMKGCNETSWRLSACNCNITEHSRAPLSNIPGCGCSRHHSSRGKWFNCLFNRRFFRHDIRLVSMRIIYISSKLSLLMYRPSSHSCTISTTLYILLPSKPTTNIDSWPSRSSPPKKSPTSTSARNSLQTPM